MAVTDRNQLFNFQNSSATRFIFNRVSCNGLETRLVDCRKMHWPNCVHSGVEDAGVRCTNECEL